MTDVGARTKGSGRKGKAAGNPISRLWAALGLYVSQVLDELRKVVRPTRSELWNYTLIVIMFVLIIMAVTSGLDWVFSHLVTWMYVG